MTIGSVGANTMNNSALWSPLLNGTKNFAKNYGLFTFGDWTTDFAQIMCGKNVEMLHYANNPLNLANQNSKMVLQQGLFRQNKFTNLWGNIKLAYNVSQEQSKMKLTQTLGKNPSSFGQYVKGTFSSWGKEISAEAAKGTSVGSKSWKGLKGVFKGMGKRMPLIGAVMALGFEIPNVIKSFTSPKGGVGTGVAETAKAGIRLGAFAGGAAAGAAIGTLICPGAGTVVGGIVGFLSGAIGGMIGDSIARSVTGKTFSEKEEEASAQAQAQTQGVAQTPQGVSNAQTPSAYPQLTPEQVQQYSNNMLAYNNQAMSNPFASNPYMNQQNFMDKDIMAMSAGLIK